MSAGLTKEWGAFVDWRRVALAAVAVGLPLAAVPLVTGEFVLHVLNIGAYYVILAVSWNLLAAKEASGVAILLVEQNVEQALPLADHLYLLNLGRVKAQGPGRDFDNTRVRALIQECLLG